LHSIKNGITVSWDTMQCSLVYRYQHFRGICCLHLQSSRGECLLLWRWRQHVPLKHWYLPTTLYAITFQETVILIPLWEPQIIHKDQSCISYYTNQTHGLISSMEESPWEANSCSGNKEIPLAHHATYTIKIVKNNPSKIFITLYQFFQSFKISHGKE
jgi:hypothetical protein